MVTLQLNPRPFDAIRNGLKKVEYRTNVSHLNFDFCKLKVGDEIKFVNNISNDNIIVKVIDIRHYQNSFELFTNEGLSNSSSNPKTIDEAIERLESFTGYKEGVRKYGVWAIEFVKLNY